MTFESGAVHGWVPSNCVCEWSELASKLRPASKNLFVLHTLVVQLIFQQNTNFFFLCLCTLRALALPICICSHHSRHSFHSPLHIPLAGRSLLCLLLALPPPQSTTKKDPAANRLGQQGPRALSCLISSPIYIPTFTFFYTFQTIVHWRGQS